MRRPTPVTSKIHGFLDYMTGAQLQLVPDRHLRIAGAIHAAYSLLTDYELGVVKVIPYRAHLLLDALWVVGVAAGGKRRHFAVAAWEAAALLMSETEVRGKAPERAREANEYDSRERVVNGSAFDPAPRS
jgi:hypothetical protein